MPWVKVDDGFFEHQKFWDLPATAGWLWIKALAWSSRNLTDGVLPANVLATLHGKRKDAGQLVTVGLWEPLGDGWLIHDFHRYQPTAAHVRANREAKSKAGKKGAEKRWQTDSSVPSACYGSANAPQPQPTYLHNSQPTLAAVPPVENPAMGREEAVRHARRKLNPHAEAM